MKQNKHNFREMSDKVCVKRGCKKRIKLNVAERKTTNKLYCYKCWMEMRNQ